MALAIQAQLTAMATMTVSQLRERYACLFQEESRSGNRRYLIKRIAWRLQSLELGSLSERALQRARELAGESEIRVGPPRSSAEGRARLVVERDRRLPPPGSRITRVYKGRTLQVTVLEQGFELEGQRYRTLSALARTITGSHLNGYAFFKRALCKPRGHKAHKCNEPRGELMDDRHSKGGISAPAPCSLGRAPPAPSP